MPRDPLLTMESLRDQQWAGLRALESRFAELLGRVKQAEATAQPAYIPADELAVLRVGLTSLLSELACRRAGA